MLLFLEGGAGTSKDDDMSIPQKPHDAKASKPNPYRGRLRVTRIQHNRAGGNVKAWATIQLGQVLEIRSVKVIQQPGQKPYVRLPEVQANSRYYPAIKALDWRFRQAIGDLVLDAWRDSVVFGIGGDHDEN